MSLEAVLIPTKQTVSTIQVEFPCNTGDISNRLRNTHLGESFMLSKARIGNACQTLSVVLALENAIMSWLSPRISAQMLGTTLRRDASVFLDSFGRLWKLFLYFRGVQDHFDFAAPLLTLLHKAYLALLPLKHKISLCQRASFMLAQCICELLSSDWIESDHNAQMAIRSPLHQVLSTAHSSRELALALEDLLLPVLISKNHDNKVYVPELQV
jgi:hypothetical protein